MALITCKECGKEISESAEMCPKCGAVNADFRKEKGKIPSKYTPITPWGYVGYQLLFSIPVVGLIILCIYAFGNTENINLKNYAKSYFCLVLIAILLILVILLLSLLSLLS